MTRPELVLRSGRRIIVSSVPERPRVAQALFILLYAGFWFLGWAELPGIGRPEKLVVFIGLLALPRATGSFTMPSPLVTVGLAGVLATYYASSFVSGMGDGSLDFILSLTARVIFLWVCFVLLQSASALKWATWLLMASSIVAACVALAVMAKHGIGIGRIDPKGLESTLVGTATFSVFASAQLATMGAVLLLGARGLLASTTARIVAPLAGLLVCATAYLSYFRREHLISIPLVLLMLLLGGGRNGRKAMISTSLVAFLGFAGIVSWDYYRDDSVLGSRIESELEGNFIEDEDTRLINFRAQLQAIAASPLIGYGAGRHASAITPYVTTNERFLSGFNILGWLAVEGGVPCALFYLLMLVGMWNVAWRWRHLDGPEPYAVVLRCAPALVLQVMLWGIFGNAWDLPLGWFVFGMILAAAKVAGRGDSHDGEALRSIQYRTVAPVPAAIGAVPVLR